MSRIAEWSIDSPALPDIPCSGEKRCPACGETKPALYFSADRTARDLLNYECRLCAAGRHSHSRSSRRWEERNGSSLSDIAGAGGYPVLGIPKR